MAMILAGGRGERLFPLTEVRAKPAVEFGGKYRIIDFALNNMINSRVYKIKVLTQFKSNSLIKHLSDTWHMNRMIGHFIDVVPAQMRTGEVWYQGVTNRSISPSMSALRISASMTSASSARPRMSAVVSRMKWARSHRSATSSRTSGSPRSVA